MNKEPETYEELMRKKRCVELTKYYNLTQSQLDSIYNFLATNPNGMITGSTTNLGLYVGLNVQQVIQANCIDSSVDGVKVTEKFFTIIPHYTPSTSSYSSYSGSSSNNNNNNNN